MYLNPAVYISDSRSLLQVLGLLCGYNGRVKQGGSLDKARLE